MDTRALKQFAQLARRGLIEQVAAKLEQVLSAASAARRENASAVMQLEKQIADTSREQLIEKVAYTWFNRFCAIRYMDVNGYTRIRVVSPADESQVQPEILAEAKMGHMDEDRIPDKTRNQVAALLNGTMPSRDPQQEAYRLLLVAECNSFYRAMPYLFEHIADYTELLMPDDLLSANSILAATRAAMTPEDCSDVEVIGWLYQFYISEKKDEVFAGLKKNQKITPENIPAATQLFTPHWIVRYLVENSLGRLWMLNHPSSPLAAQMAYYIKPDAPETGFLKIQKPEDIKVCDPACGSGHMLTYAFDLLYAIYEEVGTDPSDIPEKILTHNLYGIELDERAGNLAAFALTMKARAKQRRFFNKAIEPNICVLEKIEFSDDELAEYMTTVGRDLVTQDLRETLKQFEEADNFGSLIRPKLTNAQDVLVMLEAKNLGGNLFLQETHEKVLTVLRQADYLSPKYQIVVANPPYMGGKGMNGRLSNWSKEQYPISRADTYSMFMERGLELVSNHAYCAMVTMESWMFIYSFEKFRAFLLEQSTISSMVHMPYLGKGGTSMGISFGTSATIFAKSVHVNYKGHFCCVRYFELNNKLVPVEFPPLNERLSFTSSNEFRELPGHPIAYWTSNRVRKLFKNNKSIGEIAEPRRGLATNDNQRFIRYWVEVSFSKAAFDCLDRNDSVSSLKKWFPYNKGGEFRKWYGNNDYFVNWENDGEEMFDLATKLYGSPTRTIKNLKYYFREGASWSMLGTGRFSARRMNQGFIFDQAADSLFVDRNDNLNIYCGLLNSPVLTYIKDSINPTINTTAGVIAQIPYALPLEIDNTIHVCKKLIDMTKQDWDSSETSWDFSSLPLLKSECHQPILEISYQQLRTHWHRMTLEVQRLEGENNRIFIDAYDLQDELTPEVQLNEITLTCNPHYRYGGKKTEEELEALLLADTMCEFISYAVGCMFGRYSLDKPGLVLANQGETLANYLRQIPEPRFTPDKDNVIPLLDGDWFADDITERLQQFLRTTFGEEHYEENLAFIEDAIGKDLRKFFLRDFYNDHVKRYRKRPIYWLFSSPKGTFNALIYLHRYRPDTVSVVLQYLREFRNKLAARLDHLQQVSISTSASQVEKTRALKEIDALKKQLLELDDYERDTLYPLATQQITLDLDDGVKVNYLKFGSALKKIVGLDAKGED